MKKLILGIFIGILVSGGVVYGANLIDSKDVTYTPNNSNFNVSNVKNSIDKLYDKIQNESIEKLELVANLTVKQRRVTSVSNKFTGEKDKYYYLKGYYIYGAGGSTNNDLNIGINTIVGRLTVNNATIISEYPDLDIVRIKAINDGDVAITMNTGVSSGNYDSKFFIKVYK